MGVSKKQGTLKRPQDTIILIRRTSKKGPAFLEIARYALALQRCLYGYFGVWASDLVVLGPHGMATPGPLSTFDYQNHHVCRLPAIRNIGRVRKEESSTILGSILEPMLLGNSCIGLYVGLQRTPFKDRARGRR